MLSLCRAYVVAQTVGQDRTLRLLAERVGFSHVGSARDGDPIAEISPRRLDFFFLHHRLGEETMQNVIATIRSSPRLSLRFAPIILVTSDQPLETILNCIELGFDDIVTLPAKPAELMRRFIGQLNTNQVYVETDFYLGPDRRRFEAPGYSDPRRTGTTTFQRFTIRRNPANGVQVLRHEVVSRPFQNARRPTQVAMI